MLKILNPLKREEIVKNISLEDLREKCNIADRVYKQLGYSLKTHGRCIGPLAATLKDLRIEPFDPSSVRKYKAKMLKIPSSQRRKFQYAGLGLIAMLAGLITFLAMHNVPDWLMAIGVVMCIASVVGIIVTFVVAYDFVAINDWNRYTLAAYKGEVPEFALLRALEVKEKLPAANFYVDALEHAERHIVRNFDPFLLVELGEERFYIDVWDEPQFERKL